MARGRVEGEAKALTKFLKGRFGPLPDSIRARIESADIESLDCWLDRLVTGASLDSIVTDA